MTTPGAKVSWECEGGCADQSKCKAGICICPSGTNYSTGRHLHLHLRHQGGRRSLRVTRLFFEVFNGAGGQERPNGTGRAHATGQRVLQVARPKQLIEHMLNSSSSFVWRDALVRFSENCPHFAVTTNAGRATSTCTATRRSASVGTGWSGTLSNPTIIGVCLLTFGFCRSVKCKVKTFVNCTLYDMTLNDRLMKVTNTNEQSKNIIIQAVNKKLEGVETAKELNE